MGKYKGKFTVGWLNIETEEDSMDGLIRAIEKEQDFTCLIQQVSMMGTKKDKQEIQKLITFLEKRNNDELTVEDVRNLNIRLSVGSVKCDELIEQE